MRLSASRTAARFVLSTVLVAIQFPGIGLAAGDFPSLPREFLTAGHTEKYALSGSDSEGGAFAVELTETTEPATEFNGQRAVPVRSEYAITNTTTNESVEAVTVAYFSPDPAGPLLLGLSDSLGGVSVATSVSAIPPTAAIGASGPVGSYTGLGNSDGEASTVTWRLTEAGGGRAHFAVETQISFLGAPISTERHVYEIDAQGQRRARTIELHDLATGDTLTLSGDRK